MRKRLIWTVSAVCAVLVLAAMICLLRVRAIGREAQSARQAERWAGDSEMDYVQLSLCFTKQDPTNLESIYRLRQKLADQFVTEGLAEDGAVLICDAWSASGSLRVVSERADANPEVLAVGGSFFDFHPMELLSGCYFSANDLMKDRIVIDELLAWLLFGSSNVAGMQVEINELPFEIAGVVRQDDSKSIQKFRSDSPTLYMPYETYNAMKSENISCYEIVVPEPIDGYGAGLVEENLSIGGGVLQTVTGRFSLANAWKLLKEFNMRGTQTKAVSLPYWENAARYDENRCALWLLAALVLLICPAICFLVLLVWAIIKGRKLVKTGGPKLIHAIGDFFYRISSKLHAKRNRSV